MSGRAHIAFEQQHRKYGKPAHHSGDTPRASFKLGDTYLADIRFLKLKGSVFRVSPNEVSFASVDSWRSIYGYPPQGQAHLIKSEFYDIFGAAFDEACIGSERDPHKHAQKKRTLAAAFSPKALEAQEHIVQQVWDNFCFKVGHASQKTAGGINLVKWLELATFDALGEMAFGESFGCLDNGECKQHGHLISCNAERPRLPELKNVF